MWQQSALTWPTGAQGIQDSAETVTNQVGNTMNTAVGRLTPLQGDAAYGRHDLSSEASGLLGLRTDLNQTLVSGTIISATPYQFQVGQKVEGVDYLNPSTAVKTLSDKLRDLSDIHRPKTSVYCIAIMLTADNLGQFASLLKQLVAVLPLPDWSQTSRQATALTSNEQDKLHQPTQIIQPRFKPMAKLNANPLGEYFKEQGSQIATLESLASDATSVISKLQALAAKRSGKVAEISGAIEALKTLQGSVWSFATNGTPESIATQLSQATLPNNHKFTIASLMLSQNPMPFFEELLT